MRRLLIVAYRPEPGQRQSVLDLLRDQHRRARDLGVLAQDPLIGEGTHGELVLIATFEAGAAIDRLWEDESFQDIDARLGRVARMVPVHTLQEASASYIDLAGLDIRPV
ncbi:hypothetical protein [Luteibacter sahnii]|uniref:hypothetical protein n=1 Tax=Luteibacter sahnii TaxID=3021977 RepID=UPI002A699342|nr:hypothetical protein [Luteibacter sp. PPL193]MDY1547617.1 hypothetical protein [Luteibacter sp. PPL193]